jgi:hypothetical protein
MDTNYKARGSAEYSAEGISPRSCDLQRNPVNRTKITAMVATSLLCITGALPLSPAIAMQESAPAAPAEKARILSAAWGTSGASSCPSGGAGLDNIPVVFNWFLRASTVDAADFAFTLDNGTTVTPTCALLFPPNEANERQTINLIGEFGDPAGARPVTVAVVGAVQGHPIGEKAWRNLPTGLTSDVVQLEAAPFIVDAWMLTPQLLRRDRNKCTQGTSFVRVVWSNGMTAYPTGAVLGQEVVDSYRAIFRTTAGKRVVIAPVAVGDINDHNKPFLEDNMQDLCLSDVPRGAVLSQVTIGANVLQDPNGDPNATQRFRVR